MAISSSTFFIVWARVQGQDMRLHPPYHLETPHPSRNLQSQKTLNMAVRSASSMRTIAELVLATAVLGSVSDVVRG